MSQGSEFKGFCLQFHQGKVFDVRRLAFAVEGDDQREIGSIEHQLEAHVNDQQVAPQQYPQQTQAKKDRADDEIVLEADVHLRLKR